MEQCHGVVLCTAQTEFIIKNKRRGRKIINHHTSCPWFATSTTRQASSLIANHGHSDGIPLSLPQCGDRFYYSHEILTQKNKKLQIEREKGRDLTQSYDKSPYTNRNVKRAKWQHKQRHKKSSIKQRLRTDLGRSVGVTTATQLVWLTGLRAHLPTNRNSRLIKRTHV